MTRLLPAARLVNSAKFPVPFGIAVAVLAIRLTGPPVDVYTPNPLKLLLTPRNVTAPPLMTGASKPF